MQRLFSIIIILTLLLASLNAFAGVDDSNLQVFTLTGDKLLGSNTMQHTEDSSFGDFAVNVWNDNGLTQLCLTDDPAKTFTYNLQSVYQSYVIDAQRLPIVGKAGTYYGQNATIAMIKEGNTSSVNLYYSNSLINIVPKDFGPNGAQYVNGSYNNDGFLYAASYTAAGVPLVFVLTPNAYTLCSVSLTDGHLTPGNPTGSSSRNYPSTKQAFFIDGYLLTADAWQNRTWIAQEVDIASCENRLRYSSATDVTDFTGGPTLGGIIDLPEAESIKKIIGTQYGLYVFTDKNIWLVYGDINPMSWSLKKIWQGSDYKFKKAFKYNEDVFIYSDDGNEQAVFKASGLNIDKIIHFPSTLPTYFIPNIIHNKYLTLGDTSTYGYFQGNIYDMEAKCYYTWQKVQNCPRNSGYFISRFYDYNTHTTILKFYPNPDFEENYFPTYFNTSETLITYETAWQTLDGIGSNLKNIKRVEIDYDADTQEVLQCTVVRRTNNSNYAQYDAAQTFKGYTDGDLTSILHSFGTHSPTQTAFINLNLMRRPATKFKFMINTFGAANIITRPIRIKQIRVYYQPVGNPLRSNLK